MHAGAWETSLSFPGITSKTTRAPRATNQAAPLVNSLTTLTKNTVAFGAGKQCLHTLTVTAVQQVGFEMTRLD